MKKKGEYCCKKYCSIGLFPKTKTLTRKSDSSGILFCASLNVFKDYVAL